MTATSAVRPMGSVRNVRPFFFVFFFAIYIYRPHDVAIIMDIALIKNTTEV